MPDQKKRRKEPRFKIVYNKNGHAHAIKYAHGQYILHLIDGTIINEHFAKTVVDILNGDAKREDLERMIDQYRITYDVKKHLGRDS